VDKMAGERRKIICEDRNPSAMKTVRKRVGIFVGIIRRCTGGMTQQ